MNDDALTSLSWGSHTTGRQMCEGRRCRLPAGPVSCARSGPATHARRGGKEAKLAVHSPCPPPDDAEFAFTVVCC